MKKTLLDGEEFRFKDADLPLLIHGEEGSGASLYTISVAAGIHARGGRFLFLCGYPMAKEEFVSQAGPTDERALFFTKEEISGFEERLADAEGWTVVIKNVELFGADVVEKALRSPRAVISGDVGRSAARAAIVSAGFRTKVLFSALSDEALPKLGKYEAYLKSSAREGVTGLA